MKTRTGLVSNSSSSSFILVGVPIMMSELNESHLTVFSQDRTKITIGTVVMGKHLGEGRDVFHLSEPGQLAFIKDNPEFFHKAFVKCLYMYDPDGEISLKSLIDAAGPDSVNMVILGGTADQASSYSLNGMLENYSDELTAKTKKNVAETYRKKYTTK